MKVIGLDLSLTATGVAWDAANTGKITTKSKGMVRLAEVRDAILRVCRAADLVVVEGYSMGPQRGSQGVAQALGELGGVVKLALHEADIPYADCPPACLKRYSTGKGNANKGEVLEAASKRSGLDFGGDNNRADAFWLRQMGLARLASLRPTQADEIGREGLIPMPAPNRAGLAGVSWPTLIVREAAG